MISCAAPQPFRPIAAEVEVAPELLEAGRLMAGDGEGLCEGGLPPMLQGQKTRSASHPEGNGYPTAPLVPQVRIPPISDANPRRRWSHTADRASVARSG